MHRTILLTGMIMLLAGCGAKQFAGIPLTAGAAPADLQRLAARAEDGDKEALLALGIRFEHGDGVARDLVRAEQLYVRAAASQPVYAQLREVPVSKHGVSGVQQVQTGIVPGLPEARERLAALRRARGD